MSVPEVFRAGQDFEMQLAERGRCGERGGEHGHPMWDPQRDVHDRVGAHAHDDQTTMIRLLLSIWTRSGRSIGTTQRQPSSPPPPPFESSLP